MSRAWKDFTKISQNEAKCVHCGLVIAMRKSSTAKLLAHIAKHHSKASPVADGVIFSLPLVCLVIFKTKSKHCTGRQYTPISSTEGQHIGISEVLQRQSPRHRRDHLL